MVMSVDLFEFWSQIDRGARIHPADKRGFDRIRPEEHGVRLDCLPACFTGPLRDAPVVVAGFRRAGRQIGRRERLLPPTLEGLRAYAGGRSRSQLVEQSPSVIMKLSERGWLF